MTPKKTASKRSNGNGAEKKETSKAEPKPPAPKTRSRKTAAAPAPPTPYILSDEEIARKAYALWESRGKPHGSPEEDWHRAKEQLGI